MKIITRNEAKIAGEKYYFTGIPCPYQHIDYRRVFFKILLKEGTVRISK